VAIRAEGVFSLAAGVGLPGTHEQGKTETLSKTRVWGFGEKKLPCFRQRLGETENCIEDAKV
jgi:hypothetical protein